MEDALRRYIICQGETEGKTEAPKMEKERLLGWWGDITSH